MTTYYKATFSDGTVLKRATTSRKYTHAWLARWQNKAEIIARGWGETSQDYGFCGTELNASNTLRRYCRGPMLLAEVAPAIEVSRKEYTTKKGA